MGANLKEVRERMVSVKNTQQITKAMKMVSAAKLRRAQQAITEMRPYAEKLNDMSVNIMSNADGGGTTSYGIERPVQNALIIVVTSNRGLCGGFNSNILKAAIANFEAKYSDLVASGNLTFLCVGKKGYEFFSKRYTNCTFIEDYVNLFDDLSFANVKTVAKVAMDGFNDGTYDAIDASYGRFKNAAMQFAETEQFLPVPKTEVIGVKKSKADYIFEPDQNTLLESLIPSILETQFLKYCLDTHASEHGARMTAMDKATENADDLLKDLRISYNKARQEAITNELSEIVGGAAALESA